MRDQHESGGNLQSVRRALRALELISEHGELGVTELGRKLDVHKATASRLIATLAERGFVERDPISEKYRLGFGLISLAGAAVGGNDLVRAARPILDDLAERTHETVNLGVLSGDSVVYIDQVTGTRSIVSVSWVGQRTPLHCTSCVSSQISSDPQPAVAPQIRHLAYAGESVVREFTAESILLTVRSSGRSPPFVS